MKIFDTSIHARGTDINVYFGGEYATEACIRMRSGGITTYSWMDQSTLETLGLALLDCAAHWKVEEAGNTCGSKFVKRVR